MVNAINSRPMMLFGERLNTKAGTMRQPLIAACLIAGITSATSGQTPTIDGLFTEWTPAQVVPSDPQGDATGAFDVSEVHWWPGGCGIATTLQLATAVCE